MVSTGTTTGTTVSGVGTTISGVSGTTTLTGFSGVSPEPELPEPSEPPKSKISNGFKPPEPPEPSESEETTFLPKKRLYRTYAPAAKRPKPAIVTPLIPPFCGSGFGILIISAIYFFPPFINSKIPTPQTAAGIIEEPTEESNVLRTPGSLSSVSFVGFV